MQKVGDNIYVLIMLGIAGSAVLCAGIIYFITAYVKKTARQKTALKQKEMEYQAALFTVAMQSQQEEQRKIGREIHDHAGSILSSLKLKLSDAVTNGATQNVLTDCMAGVDAMINTVRNISHVLSPPELELSGFHEALDSLCHSFPGITIVLHDDAEGLIPRSNFQLSFSLYRIMQELISNTVKHAEASLITIHVKNDKGVFIIDYSDDGKGMDPGMQQRQGIGMQNIKSRMLMIHARCLVESSEGKGYRFIIYLDHQYISP